MRILAVTNLYPNHLEPNCGVFVEQQIKGLKQIGLDVDVMFVDRVKDGMGVYLVLGRRVRSRIAELKPTIVHVMYGGIMAESVIRVTQHIPIPTVVTFHGSDILGQNSSGLTRKVITRYGVWASWKAARLASGIVVVSKILEDALPEDINRSKIRIIPCGIDLDRFKPLNQDLCRKKLGWRTNRFHILFQNDSGDPIKRPDLAYAAAEMVSRSGICAEMHVLRGVPNNEVPIWLNASDVLLLTSLHEGSPTIIKEALACNLPIVSVDVGDVSERVKQIEGCYLAMPNPDDLAAKLIQVRAGSQRIEGRIKMQELSLERVALRLKEFYGEVLVYSKSQLSTEALATS